MIIVLTTCKSAGIGKKLAAVLLKKKLAACVSLHPVTSAYRWKKKIKSEKEVLLFIKTEQKLAPRLAAEIKKNHTYKVPEIVGLHVFGASKPYLNWLREELRGTTSTKKAKTKRVKGRK